MYNSQIFVLIGILLFILEIILFTKSRQIQSTPLKISIMWPLILIGVLIIALILNNFLSLILLGVVYMLTIPGMIISTTFSIISLIKIEDKKIPLASLIMNIISPIFEIIVVLTIGNSFAGKPLF